MHIFHKYGEWEQINKSHYYKRACKVCKKYKMRSIGFLRLWS